eukprot:gene6533-10540_t
MSKKKYHFINHYLHIDFEKAEEKFHHLSKDCWIPFLILSLDDAWKWTGRGGLKKKNDKKECKTGITSWKIVDKKGFKKIVYKNLGDADYGWSSKKNQPLWKLCHDGDPAHTTKIVKEDIETIGLKLWEQPTWSPDMKISHSFLLVYLEIFVSH